MTTYNEDFWTDMLANPKPVAQIVATPAPVFEEVCPRCHGSGKFRSYSGRTVGPCFHCKGTGKVTFKTSAATRAHNREAAQSRKALGDAANFETFAAGQPAIWGWIKEEAEKGNEFAVSLKAGIAKYGDLTERQATAVQRKLDAKAADKAKAEAVSSQLAEGADKLRSAFEAALTNGLKKPILRFDGFTASLAKASSLNAGAIYLKSPGGTYLGKVMDGKFSPSRDLRYYDNAEVTRLSQKIEAAMENPVEAAIQYGRSTGTCSCCGRTLTDPESVAAGIGPVCASKFGF